MTTTNSENEITLDIYLLKQHTPVNGTRQKGVIAEAFGYFDGIILDWGDGKSNTATLNYSKTVLHTFSYKDLSEKANLTDLQKMYIFSDPSKQLLVDSKELPFLAVLCIQFAPHCDNLYCDGSLATRFNSIINSIIGSIDAAIDVFKRNEKSKGKAQPMVKCYPFFALNQVDLAIVFSSNSLVFLSDIVENFVRSNPYSRLCFTGETDAKCTNNFCCVSSYTVCGVRSKYKGKYLLLPDGRPNSKVIENLCKSISEYDGDSGRLRFSYHTQFSNITGLSNKMSNVQPMSLLSCTMGALDYVYSTELCDDIKKLAPIITTAISYNNLDSCISSSELIPLVEVHRDPQESKPNKVEKDVASTYFHDLFKKYYALLIKGESNGEYENSALGCIGRVMDERYNYCNLLWESHYAPAVGAMLLPAFMQVYTILTGRFLYLSDKKNKKALSDLNYEPILEAIYISDVSAFLNNVNVILSCLASSTVMFAETQDFKSDELNTYSKYIIAYYLCAQTLLNEFINHKKYNSQIFISVSDESRVKNEYLFKCALERGVNYNDRVYDLNIITLPMIMLRNPNMFIPQLLHEIGHIASQSVIEEHSEAVIKCAKKIVTEYMLMALIPRHIQVKEQQNSCNDLFSIYGYNIKHISGETVVCKGSDLISNAGTENHLTAINDICTRQSSSLIRIIADKITEFIRICIEKQFEALFADAYSWADIICGVLKNDFDNDEVPDRLRSLSYSKTISYTVAEKEEATLKEINQLLESDGVCNIYNMLELLQLYNPLNYTVNQTDPSKAWFGQVQDLDYRGYNLYEITNDSIIALGEVFADLFMIKSLGIEPDSTEANRYLSCFDDETLKVTQGSLANALRIVAILLYFFDVPKNSISDVINSYFQGEHLQPETYTWICQLVMSQENPCAVIHRVLPYFNDFIKESIKTINSLLGGYSQSDIGNIIKTLWNSETSSEENIIKVLNTLKIEKRGADKYVQ